MKVILKEDIDNLGSRGDVVDVKDGYARNYLIPRAYAMRFTPGAEKVLTQERRKYDARQVKEREEAEAIAEVINGIDLTISKRVGESETLYGSVTTTDLCEMLAAKGMQLDRRKIALNAPIKKLGDYEIPVKLHREVDAAFQVHVIKEE